MATTKEELLELVRDLDEDGAAEVLDYVRWLPSEVTIRLKRQSVPR